MIMAVYVHKSIPFFDSFVLLEGLHPFAPRRYPFLGLSIFTSIDDTSFQLSSHDIFFWPRMGHGLIDIEWMHMPTAYSRFPISSCLSFCCL